MDEPVFLEDLSEEAQMKILEIIAKDKGVSDTDVFILPDTLLAGIKK